jgi:rhodanese-related sulfurtransferase
MKFRTTRVAGIALGLAFALTGTACSTTTDDPKVAAEAPAFASQHVGAAEFAAAAAEPGVTIIDVRTPEEYASGHLAGAVNADVESADFGGIISALDPAGDYAVYCRSGNRSRVAVDTMRALGYENLIGLEGGITAWTEAGYDVTT